MLYELIQFSNMSRHEIKTCQNNLKFEQMAHGKAEKLLVGFEQIERSKIILHNPRHATKDISSSLTPHP